jgi:hypothetical protein
MPVARNTWQPSLILNLGRAPANHAIGIDAVHRLVGEHAGLADRGAEEGGLAGVVDPGHVWIYRGSARACDAQANRGACRLFCAGAAASVSRCASGEHAITRSPRLVTLSLQRVLPKPIILASGRESEECRVCGCFLSRMQGHVEWMIQIPQIRISGSRALSVNDNIACHLPK